jgi:hypothetical protein
MRWTFEQVLQSMRELDAFWKRLGLYTEAGRVGAHISAIEALDTAQKLGNVDGIDNDQTLWSMTEAIELAGVYAALKNYDPSILARKFREVLQGPPRPAAEDSNTNHGRNTAFELSMAAWFCRQGVFRGLPDNPDVLCEVGGIPVLVQCKRPLEEKGIQRNVARARDQLRDGLVGRQYPVACGVIAISLSRIISPRSALLWGTHSARAREEARQRIDAIARSYASVSVGEPGIIATVFHVMMPVLTLDTDRPHGRLGSVNVPVIYQHYPDSHEHTELLHRLFGPPTS